MGRTADYTIQGFIYQFNKTLAEILGAQDDAEITVEGIVEDIDVQTKDALTATQCKYHEGSTGFTLSAIYKPVLQMMDHFHKNPAADIKYRLFAHFAGEPSRIQSCDSAALAEALATENKDLASYVSRLKGTVDLAAFSTRFTLEFGPSLEDLQGQVLGQLKSSGFPEDEVEGLAYPNAIHLVAMRAIRHDAKDRKVTRPQFIATLRLIRKTVVDRWTLALKTARATLKAKRLQLRANLSKNMRRRAFILSPSGAEGLAEGVVLFIEEFVEKYHSKPLHTATPSFFFDCDEPAFDDLRERIFRKGIRYNDGYVGARFDLQHFRRNPVVRIVNKTLVERDFVVRIARVAAGPEAINDPKADDLFVIGNVACAGLDTVDVNVEHATVEHVQQLKYILGITDVVE